MDIYLVGGAVRDRLLGRPIQERDWVVVGAAPEDLIARGFRQVGKDFPVFLHPKTGEEYALARTERKAGLGYTGFICAFGPEVSLEDDLRRRDLTVNAMAEGPDGELIDPYGGQQDLADRRLRHVSPAFREDPLRVLRVARFAARYAALGFHVADETLALMRTMSSQEELGALTPERVWKETERALLEAQPTIYFQVLRDCGALAVLFPELDALFGVPQRAEFHPEIDTGVHTLMVLSQAARLSDDLAVRFAALVHDLGKALTPPEEWPRHVMHEQRGVALVRNLCQRLRCPRACEELALLVTEYHLDAHRAWTLRPETLLDRFKRFDAFRRPERFWQWLTACEADARGRLGFEEREPAQSRYWQEAFAAASGVEVRTLIAEGLSGEAIGQALDQRRREAIATVRERWQAALIQETPDAPAV